MERIQTRLTVFFEDPFWVGVYERSQGGQLEVAKIVFGSEPKDYTVYGYMLENWQSLCFSPPVSLEMESFIMPNPKRMQREIARGLGRTGIGTKAQQALKAQQEQRKAERKSAGTMATDALKRKIFELKQCKKKQKHKGK